MLHLAPWHCATPRGTVAKNIPLKKTKKEPVSEGAAKIAEALRAAIKASGRRIDRVAIEAGIAHPTLYNYLNGQVLSPSQANLIRLYDVLGVPAASRVGVLS